MFEVNCWYIEKEHPHTIVKLLGVDKDRNEVHYEETPFKTIRSLSFTDWVASFKPYNK